MSERIHVLAQQLFGKSSVAECDLQEIRTLAQRYPYFAPAQFLLLEKLKQESSPEYGTQLQKSVLYYHNPLEFEYFISSGRFYAETEKEHVTEMERERERETGTGAIQTGPATEEVIVPVETGEAEPEAIPAEEVVSSIVEHWEESNHPPSDQAVFHEEQSYSDEGGVAAPVRPEPKPVEGARLLEVEAKESADPLAFEPYHTVDYFASQGIKLSQEEQQQPADKFGKQLKSFTEWLKTMKRLPAPVRTAQMDSGTEKNVQHLAEDSVHESDVVTEAMAEVWIKQGNTGKALEVYNKLSLLNPSKRAYFAAKIDHLKHS